VPSSRPGLEGYKNDRHCPCQETTFDFLVASGRSAIIVVVFPSESSNLILPSTWGGGCEHCVENSLELSRRESTGCQVPAQRIGSHFWAGEECGGCLSGEALVSQV
jgi:hypothetical protein